jgi:prephenate dehydrogenase
MLGRVTVVGCGLIGGSLVKRLHGRESITRLSVIDRAEVLASATAYIDEGASPGQPSAVAMVADSDLVVLATPVGIIARDLAWVLDAIGPDAVVTDTGSVKQPIADAAARHERGTRFVGGHPMAGHEAGGFDASSADMFEGARWFVVAPPMTSGSARETAGATIRLTHSDALARVVELIGVMGAEPVFVEPDVHDRAMAFVSHAPQLIASAVFAAGAGAGVLGDAGPGFRDMTRIAGGPAAMWHDIFSFNRQRIANALGVIIESLSRVRDGLAKNDDAGLSTALELLEQAHVARHTPSGRWRRSRESP